MPKTFQIAVSEDDIAPLRSAQKLIGENLAGHELPLEVLAAAAIRSVNAHTFAIEILATITGKEPDPPPGEPGS